MSVSREQTRFGKLASRSGGRRTARGFRLPPALLLGAFGFFFGQATQVVRHGIEPGRIQGALQGASLPYPYGHFVDDLPQTQLVRQGQFEEFNQAAQDAGNPVHVLHATLHRDLGPRGDGEPLERNAELLGHVLLGDEGVCTDQLVQLFFFRRFSQVRQSLNNCLQW